MDRKPDDLPTHTVARPQGMRAMSDIKVAKCIACGQFMNCNEIDAHCDFTPDNAFGPERVEWTCGPCVRAAKEARE